MKREQAKQLVKSALKVLGDKFDPPWKQKRDANPDQICEAVITLTVKKGLSKVAIKKMIVDHLSQVAKNIKVEITTEDEF
jgi:hypothetical protein